MAEEMNTPEQPNQEMVEDEVFDEAKREASIEYAKYFSEINWLKAISPNLVFEPFKDQKGGK